MPFNDLERAIVRDLKEACAELLDRGLASVPPSGRTDLPLGPLGITLEYADALTGLIPKAIEECGQAGNDGREHIVASKTPMRAQMPRRASDFGAANEGGKTIVAPLRWTAREPVASPPRDALAWLSHVLDGAIERAEQSVEGLDDALSQAHEFRHSTSRFGREDTERLARIETELAGSILRLTRMRTWIQTSRGTRLQSSHRFPVSAPRTRTWKILRRLDASLEDPEFLARSVALSIVRRPRQGAGADVPYLYQRWCGWRLHEAIVSFGFTPTSDVLPALLLAGRVDYRRGGTVWRLVSEPRLTANRHPLSGLRVLEGEATPDLVLIAEPEDGPAEAHVLDPTLSVSREATRQKRKYLNIVKFGEKRVISGVHVLPGPTRSWAAAPLRGTKCLLDHDDWRGLSGTIPMNPADYSPRPLLDWLGEVAGAR